MKKFLAASALALAAAAPAFATTIDFEGVTSFASIDQYYNGGADSQGAVGPALGVSFGGDALGLQNDFGSYFSNAPTPVGVMTSVGPDSAMNVAAGFTRSISFYYSSSAAVTNAVQVWSGLNGTGSVLASFSLAANAEAGGCSDTSFCHFDILSGTFTGLGHSVTFGNAANLAAFDNVNVNVAAVPEPTTALLMLIGLSGVAVTLRRKR